MECFCTNQCPAFDKYAILRIALYVVIGAIQQLRNRLECRFIAVSNSRNQFDTVHTRESLNTYKSNPIIHTIAVVLIAFAAPKANNFPMCTIPVDQRGNITEKTVEKQSICTVIPPGYFRNVGFGSVGSDQSMRITPG